MQLLDIVCLTAAALSQNLLISGQN